MPGWFGTVRSLPRAVWLLGVISLLNDSASEMVYPLVPLYLSAVLMAGPRALGLIEGVGEAFASLLKLCAGVVVDRTRRTKPWIVAGYGIAGIARPFIAFISAWPWLLCLRLADRLGKGLRASPRDALLAASIEPARRGLAFGLHRALDNAGGVLGPMLAAALLALGVPLAEVFLWAAVPGALCLALTLSLREAPHAVRPPSVRLDWSWRSLPPPFLRYLVVVGLFTLGNSSNMFLLLHARELGVDLAQVPLLWAAVTMTATVLSVPLASLSDRHGRGRFLVAGYVAYGAIYGLLGLVGEGGWLLFGLFAGFGVFLAATEGVEKALVADLAPAGRAGTAFGWFNLVTGLMLLPASVVFGWLYASAGPALAFGFAATCAWLAAALLVGWVMPAMPGPGRGPDLEET